MRPLKPWSMMLEYYNMPEKTVEAFRDLWYHTGDYLRRDAEGNYYFVDRKKDALRRRGRNISSFEVETIINGHPDVAASAAVPVRSELLEDEVMVCIELKEGATLTGEALVGWCAEHMAAFMVPRYVRFVASMPRTPSLRIQKHVLREAGVTADTWDREAAANQP